MLNVRVGFILLLIVGGALFFPGTAHAEVEIPPYIDPDEYWRVHATDLERQELLRKVQEAALQDTVGADDVETARRGRWNARVHRIFQVSRRATLLRTVMPLVRIAGPLAAAYTVWKIVETDEFSGAQQEYYISLKKEHFGSTLVVNPASWEHDCPGAGRDEGAWGHVPSGENGHAQGWYFKQKFTTIKKIGGACTSFTQVVGIRDKSAPHYTVAGCAADLTGCYGATGGYSAVDVAAAGSAVTATMLALDGIATPLIANAQVVLAAPQSYCTSNTAYACWSAFISDTGFETRAPRLLTREAPGPVAGTSAQTWPSTVTGADKTAIDTELENACTRQAFNAALAPERFTYDACTEDEQPTSAPQTLFLPRPGQLETYAEYVARLRQLGWLGTATRTALPEDEFDPLVGPNAVSALRPQSGQLVRTAYWPISTVQIGIDWSVEFFTNPANAPTPSESLPAPGTPVPPEAPPVSEPPFVPPPGPLDFTPITDIDWGCKFPFGFITCYAVYVTDTFDVSADAPRFDFNLDQLGIGHYIVDLNVMDEYMAIWRAILTVAIWVGAVYWVAANLLGFKAAGDPGAAVDDVF